MSPRSLAVSALFLGPAACAADELFSYMLVYPAAARGSNAILFVLTVLAAVVAGTGLFLSYRVLKRKTETRGVEVDRFLALLGVCLNGFFLLVVLAGFGLPKIILHATD
jgi:hypothetical protein